MDQTEIKEIVNGFAKEGIHISQEIVDHVLLYSERKIAVNGIKNREEYLPLLFKDELKNYLFRQNVNDTTMLRAAERERGECVACV